MDETRRTLEHRPPTASLLQINKEKYFFMRDGIPVTVKKPNGRTETKYAVVIDFKNPDNNHFLAIKELKTHGNLYRRRTDIVGFVNGIPLLFLELKKNTVDVQDAYTNNYTDYLDTIGQKPRSVRWAASMSSSMSGNACPSRIRAVWRWRPCCEASAKKETSWICWKDSAFLYTGKKSTSMSILAIKVLLRTTSRQFEKFR